MVEFISVDYSGLQILSYLYFKKNGATFTEIEKNTKLSSRTISLQLKKLERQKLLTRQPTGEDKFSKVFYKITEEGTNLLLDIINEDNDYTTLYPEKSERWDKFSEFLLEQLNELCWNLKKENRGYFTAKHISDWYSFVRAVVGGHIIMDGDKFYLTPLGIFELSKEIHMDVMDMANKLKCLKQISSMLGIKYSQVLTKIEYLEELENELDKFTDLLWLEVMEITLRKKKEKLLRKFTKEDQTLQS